jgi:hypothetical protein
MGGPIAWCGREDHFETDELAYALPGLPPFRGTPTLGTCLIAIPTCDIDAPSPRFSFSSIGRGLVRIILLRCVIRTQTPP